MSFNEWAALGLAPLNLERMRKTRRDRIVRQIRHCDYAGVLCFDPLNIRYATDSSNMHIWIMHNPSRAVFYYFAAGGEEGAIAKDFAAQIDELLRRHGGQNRRLAVDKIEVPGLRALDGIGVEAYNGMQLMEHAHAIKGINEINAMRCSLATGEIAVAKMRERLRPGIAEALIPWSD